MLLLLAIAGAFTGGCLKKPYPAGKVVSSVELEGTQAVDDADLLEGLTTHGSPRFLGLWQGVVFDYEVLDETLLARDLLRIERYYRARGYYEAKVTAARILQLDAKRVRVLVKVSEGQPVLTESVELSGLEAVELRIATQALRAISVRAGRPFDEDQYDASKLALLSVLRDHGFAFAKVTGKVHIALSNHLAKVELHVEPGPPSRFGAIRISGLHSLPEAPVRASLLIEEGAPYSEADLKEARDALIALGVFARVEVLEDKQDPDSKVVPVTFAVEEAKLRTVTLGAGATADALRLAANTRAGWENRNFLGGLRSLSIDVRPGVNFFPARIDNFTTNVKLLPELRSQLQLRQPAFIEGRTTGFLRGQFNLVPFLFVPEEETAEIPDVLGFRELKFALGLERAFFSHHLLVTPAYNLDFRTPFIYGGTTLDNDIVASFPELALAVDLRDDPLQPRKGLLFSVAAQANNQLLGGSGTDLRLSPEVRAFWPLSRRTVLAVRTRYGRLWPLKDPSDPATLQLLRLIRGFYSGGPGSNRGYAFQGVNRTEPLEVLTLGLDCANPAVQDARRQRCLPRPIGATELWEASVEVRFPLLGGLRGAVFADTSDVIESGEPFGVASPHLSVGPGLRYITPVGPVRADFGWRVAGLQEQNPDAAQVPSTFLGAPAALHLSLGEDF